MPASTTTTTAHIITDTDRGRLLTNGHNSQHDPDFDPPPVTELFRPDGPGTWLLSELTAIRGRLHLSVERDAHFTPDRPLSQYAQEARAAGLITT